ncbi:dihydroorotate dehydrogenase electron transfer subunit [bacterium]|jgi:dihydroorotate dehydrogenase electron transfer subunit|nr:dihydroorotate dehydrogenase electron transfer subunit [bacterium]MBT4495228.1 dihydroorotate dehydrogenase electron transfer subunit [bacterium]MBT4763562.1 dihydroorotate dehydrogenase electron transfer subunit [bacterium]MBT5400934.1 dihydroorotate dehydrogenase electron transfer subunit [bacterium]MBT5942253.1 dihydroorotate dehydrogenase electron transfer subunit [bacterium]
MQHIEQPTIVTVKEVIKESSNFKTFVLDYPLDAKPGQFLMVWLPGVDSKPFSVAWQKENEFAIGVIKVGPYTKELFKLKKGDKLGFTGPYGTSYNFEDKKKILILGGGSGIASVTYLAQRARENNIEVDFLIAAKDKKSIVYEKWLEDQGINVIHRFKKNNHERAWDMFKELSSNNYDSWYACGPELLLKKIVDLSIEKKTKCQVSLERYMKCGIGVCGSCCVDPLGICLCQAGPVVNATFANNISEFGEYYRDGSGAKVNFK